jgi:hypothetical protein
VAGVVPNRYTQGVSSVRTKPLSVAGCAWCGKRKPLPLMRHPDSSRGKTPSTCHDCRTRHPAEAWCDHHGCAHPRSQFPTTRRPIGVLNICHDAVALLAARKRANPAIQCVSCGISQESWQFRGGRSKAPACRSCADTHPGQRWCIDCADWLPNDLFYRTGQGGRFQTVRCKPCRLAFSHGITRAELAKLTGTAEPVCGACGSTVDVKIDHDHGHCNAQRGCKECVRGYLCHGCNTAEGLLRTPERAMQLARYMRRTQPGASA